MNDILPFFLSATDGVDVSSTPEFCGDGPLCGVLSSGYDGTVLMYITITTFYNVYIKFKKIELYNCVHVHGFVACLPSTERDMAVPDSLSSTMQIAYY